MLWSTRRSLPTSSTRSAIGKDTQVDLTWFGSPPTTRRVELWMNRKRFKSCVELAASVGTPPLRVPSPVPPHPLILVGENRPTIIDRIMEQKKKNKCSGQRATKKANHIITKEDEQFERNEVCGQGWPYDRHRLPPYGPSLSSPLSLALSLGFILEPSSLRLPPQRQVQQSILLSQPPNQKPLCRLQKNPPPPPTPQFWT